MASLGEDLLGVVNKLQDLVFNTIGNDSLDLPQIVPIPHYTYLQAHCCWATANLSLGSSRLTILREIFCARKHRWRMLLLANHRKSPTD